MTWQPRAGRKKPGGDEAPTGAPTDLKIPRLIGEILSERGFDSLDSVQKWLNPSLKDLRDPFTLTDMDRAVERLVRAREQQESIVIYADYDLDGTSALAILLRAFEWMGFTDVGFYQPKRLTEGYGLHNAALKRLYGQGRRLLVSVDLGITAVSEVEFARSLGMEVIITDHHLPKETLPSAVAVVNPNRGNCASGLSHLCGTGVAFYLVLALRRALSERGLLHEVFDPKELLDCFVIGTVTDLVPLIEENRVLVKHGLVQLAQTKRPGLRALLRALGLWGNPLTSQDVALRFAPKLNALSRMETGVQPIDLYLVDDELKANRLVEEVLTNNQTRQASQKSAEAEAMAYLSEHPPVESIFIYSKNFHRGVVGLVATKLSQEFGLPAFVGSLSEDEGVIVGSARLPDGMNVNVLEAMGTVSGALEQFGGHAVAAGFELREARANELRSGLEAYFAGRLRRSEPRVWLYDAQADLSEITPGFMVWYEHLGPFGAGFPTPVLLVENLRVRQVRPLKGGHFRLTLSQRRSVNAGESDAVVALWFAPPKGHPVLQEGLEMVGAVDALVEPQWNYFAGQRTLQLVIQDVRPSHGGVVN